MFGVSGEYPQLTVICHVLGILFWKCKERRIATTVYHQLHSHTITLHYVAMQMNYSNGPGIELCSAYAPRQMRLEEKIGGGVDGGFSHDDRTVCL